VGRSEPDPEQLARVVTFVSGSGAHIFFFALTLLVAFRVARKPEGRAIVLGTVVGLVAAFVDRTISAFIGPALAPAEIVSYLCLGLAGGYFGGLAGRSTLSGGVYRVSRQIGEAKDASAVAAAIGENLGGPGVEGVALWRRDDLENDPADAHGVRPRREDEARAELWGSWRADGREGWPPWLGPAEAGAAMLVTPGERSWATVQRPQLAPDKKKAWEYSGIRSALLVPLVVPGEAWRGLLMVTFRKRLHFSGRVARAYLTVASQAALVLENLRLIEEAQRTGRRGGILLERQRLAREIHDTLAQGFTGIITSLTAAELNADASAMDASFARYLKDAKRIAGDSLAETRRLVWALRPVSLDRYSLSEALSNLVREWSEQSGIEAHETTNGTPLELLPEAEVALLRAAQESLTNVHKHARASRVDVTLTYMDDRVVIDVVDDGVGFDPEESRPAVGPQDERGFGLKAMRERVEQLGGSLTVETAPGEGTAIAVELRNGKVPGTIEEIQ
jgi:signal transduction histidine kinase